ncbi:hypothetical protein FA95DRAFT_1454963, partial [Auriscalpium vulgare]
DGSACDGKVGAAAVLLRDGCRPRILRYHLGKVSDHTVYEAEYVGLLLAVELLRTEDDANRSTAISVDNQATLRALRTRTSRPGQYLATAFVSSATSLKKTRRRGFTLTLRWVPGHEDLEGNELADVEAKAAAAGASSARRRLPEILRDGLPRSASAIRQE